MPSPSLVCGSNVQGDGEDTEDTNSSSEESLERDHSEDEPGICEHSRRHATTLVPVSDDNPFATKARWTGYEVFKLIVVGLTLAPVRLVLGLLLGLTILPVTILATAGLSLQEESKSFCYNKPLAPWRLALLRPFALLARGMLWCVGFWCIHLIDHRGDKAQMPNIIVVAPHMTFADMLVVCWAFPPCISWVGDAKILRVMPFLGHRAAIATQSILCAMRDPVSRNRVSQLLEERAHPEWHGLPTGIFPEGRITNGGKLIQFKMGPFKAGEPVLPVLLRYPYRYLDPSSTGSNWGPLWFIRMMTQFVNHCTIEVLAPYHPCESEAANPALYAQEVRSLMAVKLGVGTTEHTVDDAFLYRAARQAHVGSDFEVASARRLFNVDLKQLLQWLHMFQRADQDHSGLISRDEFRTIVGSMDSEDADRIFDFFDSDENGSMEYREFVQCLALISGRCSAESQAELAFRLYDVEGRGKISKAKLRDALDVAFCQRSTRGLPSALSPGRPDGEAFSGLPRFGSTQTVANLLLLPEMVSTRPSVTSLTSDGPEDEEIDFESFCQLIKQHPRVLEDALEPLKRHFSNAKLKHLAAR